MVSRYEFTNPRKVIRESICRVLDRIALPTETRPLYPIVKWDLLPGLKVILDDPHHNLAVGSVVAAGHMPNGFSDEMLRQVGVERSSEGVVERISKEQIGQLHQLKKEAEAAGRGKDGPFRFIDTMENIQKQEQKLYTKLKKKYEKEKAAGADKVLFSVCAISAGFDLNYSNALLRLMDEDIQKTGKTNIVFSIFLPFSLQGVTDYSVSNQGVNPEYWVNQWNNLQKRASELPNNIFIHEPQLLPPPKGTKVNPASTDDVKSIHQRGQDVNGSSNTVYSDVNRKLVGQALYAVRWDAKKVYGIFAEAFETSKALLGGGPEIMAMLLYAGVPIWNIGVVQAGLTEFKRLGRTRALVQYLRKFRPLMKEWDEDPLITAAWGPDYAPLRRARG